MKLLRIKTHNDHLKLLKILQKDTKYFVVCQISQINDDHEDFVLKFCKSNLKLIETKCCAGLLSDQKVPEEHKNPQYTFELNDNSKYRLFNFLKEFETFFHREVLFRKNEKYQHRCDFGLDDVAFIDEKGNVLCYTVTHEWMLWANDDIIKLFNK